MKKIKKFKIRQRLCEVMRIFKNTSKISEITLQLEQAIQCELFRLSKDINTAAAYETFSKEKLQSEFLHSAPESSVAVTLYLVTIGNRIKDEMNSARAHNEQMLEQIIHAIALESLEQSANFVYRLINEDAKKEKCELTSKERVVSDDVVKIKKIFEFLAGDKIGINLSENGLMQPLYSSCGLIYWIPVKRKSSK
jgi:hypothetical protein